MLYFWIIQNMDTHGELYFSKYHSKYGEVIRPNWHGMNQRTWNAHDHAIQASKRTLGREAYLTAVWM